MVPKVDLNCYYEGRTMLNSLRRNVDAWRWNTVQILIRSWWTNSVFIFTSTETSLCDWVEMTDWFGKRRTKSKHSATLLVWCREMWKSLNALDRPQSSSWELFKTMAVTKLRKALDSLVLSTSWNPRKQSIWQRGENNHTHSQNKLFYLAALLHF